MQYGRGDWIRTSDRSAPSRVLYQTELLPDSSSPLNIRPAKLYSSSRSVSIKQSRNLTLSMGIYFLSQRSQFIDRVLELRFRVVQPQRTHVGGGWRKIGFFEVTLAHQFLHAFDRVPLVVEKTANMAEKLNVFWTIVAPATAAFDGTYLRKFGFPKSKDVSRQIQFFSNLAYGAKSAG